MRMKWLVLMMGVLFLLGLSGPALADWVYDDSPGGPCGDTWDHTPFYDAPHQAEVDTKDIEKAKVEFFPVPDPDGKGPGGSCSGLSEDVCRAEDGCYWITEPSPQCREIPEWVYLCIHMCPDCTLAGQVHWEFDVDNDSTTGGSSSMLGIPVSPGSNEDPLKTCAGFDLIVQKAYREQGPGSAMDPGNPICYKKGPACPDPPDCDHYGCYERGAMCTPKATNCWVVEATCDCIGTADCDVFTDTLCSEASSAGIGKKRGGWTASLFNRGGKTVMGGIAVDWGRDMPEPPLASTAQAYCEKIPWRQIIQEAVDEIGYDQEAFNNAVTTPEWEVATYHDPYYPDDHYGSYPPDYDMDDYLDTSLGDYMNITDWMPHADCTKAASQKSDGGTCHRLQGRHHNCMYAMGIQEDYAAWFDTCKAKGESDCLADERCYWWAGKSKCLTCDCFAESAFQGKVGTNDFIYWKWESGRKPCPCQ